jgi:transglutaminase-like putative cysteine protease
MTYSAISRSSLIFILLIIIGLRQYAVAAAPWVHLSAKPKWLNTYKPYDKQIPERDVENGYFYQLLEEQVNIETKADYAHVIRKIVSATGIQNGSEISVSFDPTYERLDFHEIIVWRDNKPQNRLSANAFKIIADEKDLSKFIYQGTYSAYCILSDIRKGDRIEYSYTITGRNPILGSKFCRDMYLQQAQPVAHIYKSILSSPARKLNFKSFNKVPKMVQSVKNGLNCFEWEDFQVQPARDYDNQAGWSTSYAYVQISDFSSWNEVVKWAMAINPIATNITGDLAKQIAKFKAEAGNDKEKYFRSAVKLVQDEVRYMGIEMGEYSHRANRPEKVYNQRYGDCKDKALLLASILKAGDIPASMVLINTNAKSKTDRSLPSAYVFDHATVTATVNGKQVWIDATVSNQRGTGINLYYPNYGQGLVLTPASNSLTVISPSPMGLITCHENYTVHSDTDKVDLNVVTTYTLNEADKIRDRLASSSMSETEKNYLSYYQKIYPKIDQADSITIVDNEEKNQITVKEHYLITGFFKTDTASGKLEASFYADYINDELTNVNTKIRYPRALNYPRNINYTTSLVLPGGWSISDTQTNIKRDAYVFTAKRSTAGDTLFLNYRLAILKDYIPVEKTDEYAADMKQIKDNELGFSFTYTPQSTLNTFRLNYWMLILVIAFVLIIAGVCVKLYRTETHEIVFELGANFMPLGGWPVFIAFGLGITVLALLVNLASGDYFSLTKWNAHLNTRMEYSFKALFVFEALGNALTLCYSLFCLILLLNRRDILPRFIIGFYIYSIAFLIADQVWANILVDSTDIGGVTYAITRTLIIACIWIPYFLRSERVAHTFIVPYPATNYRYEEMEAKV